MIMGKRLRVYYMAQVAVQPPKFIFFVNIPTLMTESYKKYLYNQFREKYGFSGVPLLFYLKGKKPKRESASSMKDHDGLTVQEHEKNKVDSLQLTEDFEDEFGDFDPNNLDESYFD